MTIQIRMCIYLWVISTSSKMVSVNILPICELLSEIVLERLSLELIVRKNFDDPFRISGRSFRFNRV